MKQLSTAEFLRTMPDAVLPHLPPWLKGATPRQPFRWIVQIHFGEPRLHYEVSRVRDRGWELGFHCESRDKNLNRLVLTGFRRHLFEIKVALGEQFEAEMWDRGWSKAYEVVDDAPLTAAYQQQIGLRLATIITHLHPIYVDVRDSVSAVVR